MEGKRTRRLKFVSLLAILVLLILSFSGMSVFAVNRFEETNQAIVYNGSWSSNGFDGLSGSPATHKVSNEAKATAEVAFTGTYINWVAYESDNKGIAKVYVDGNYVKDVDLYSQTPKYQAIVYSQTGFGSGRHTFKIEVTANKNSSSKGNYISLDAIEADSVIAFPANLSVSALSEGAKLKLGWEIPSGYHVQIWRSDSRYQPPEGLVNFEVTDSPYFDGGLVAGVAYTYYLVGVDNNNSSYTSIPSKKVSGVALPPRPTNVSVKNEGIGGRLLITWTNPVNPATYEYIRIYRSTVKGVLGSVVTLDQIGKDVSSYADMGLINGVTYYYTVRTVDIAGNESTNIDHDQAVNTPSVGATYFEEDSPSVSYTGAWDTRTEPSHSGGSHKVSNSAGSKATFSFYGTSVAWIAAKGPNRGIASVTLDGTGAGNVDLYSSSYQYQQKVYVSSGLSDSSHTLTIDVLQSKHRNASDYYVSVDAFATGVSAMTPSPTISSPAATSTPVAGVTVGSGEIVGRVVNRAGQTIPGTAVRVNATVVPTNPGGEFRFTLVGPGTYTVYYDAPGYRGQTQVIEVKSGQATRCPTVIMDPGITPSTQGEIFGRVVNSVHQPIAWAAVRISNIVVPTNAAGEFRFQLVNPGVYTVYYDAAGFAGQTQVLEVKAGMVTYPPMVILSGTLGEIYGRVLDISSRRAISGTAVRVNSSVMPTNPGGEFRFTLVHPGIYKVYYDAPGYGGQVQENIAVFAGTTTICPTVLMSR